MTARGFLKWLSLLLVTGYAMLFTMVWLNAYTFGNGQTVLIINEWGEANPEALILFGVFWPIVSVGLYFLAVDGGAFPGSSGAVEGGAEHGR